MHFPRADDDSASSQHCNKWDKIFRPNKKCLPPTTANYASNPSTTAIAASATSTAPAIAKGAPTDAVVAVVIIGIIVLGVTLSLLYICFNSFKKHLQKRDRARVRRASLSQPPQRPHAPERRRRSDHRSGLPSWWNQFTAERGAGATDAEMGRLQRGFTRVRSIAKTNPEITIPPLPRMRVGEPNPNPYMSRPSHITRNSATRTTPASASRHPTDAPPRYDNMLRGSPIADQFAASGRRGAGEERVGTPPPTYQQRTEDWYVSEVDGRPPPDYTYFSLSSLQVQRLGNEGM